MAGRMWGAIKSWLVRFRWLLALGALALLVILACVFFIPLWLLQWELGGQARTLAAADRATAINDIRTTLLQGIGGVLLVLGAFFTYRQLQTSRDQLAVAEQGQVTERFTRAIDQLSKERTIDQRIGGIYALDRIMRDSPKDHSAVVEVLAAFIRGRAAMPPSAVTDSPDAAPEDVEAALTVLGHRPQRPDMEVTPIRLSSQERPTNLSGTILRGAHLQCVRLRGAHLEDTHWESSHLEGARLRGAYLQDGDLEGTHLNYAHMKYASLNKANLKKAHLDYAELDHADLQDADLEGAHLAGVQGELGLTPTQAAQAHCLPGDLTCPDAATIPLPEDPCARYAWYKDKDVE